MPLTSHTRSTTRSSTTGCVASVDRSTLTIDELALRYLEHATDYYVKDDKPTSEVACIRAAFRPMVKLFGPTIAAAFGPLRLKAVRDEMIRRG
jgi:hypothetical protein